MSIMLTVHINTLLSIKLKNKDDILTIPNESLILCVHSLEYFVVCLDISRVNCYIYINSFGSKMRKKVTKINECGAVTVGFRTENIELIPSRVPLTHG